ncbi:hypothetical protein WKH56_20420 [Priestia sp. SB1]|uniref:hypothetical protein n=1 Tax=Priestia TaxID=2800373 RepID=UPI0028780D93|nr:hypothetical protein [Priestia megaterium]
MYLVEWIDENGKEKSIVADAWITEIAIVEDLKEKGYEPTSKTFDEVLAERV